ncbi:MAG: hypothetical protein FVQ80_14585 [Planctomycetes bacterium]|nr:hypothetical protein [Planctomycetota bacterium]
MLIEKDSSLRRIPLRLDDRQAAFLDGLRLSFEMIDIAYKRLSTKLEEFNVEESKTHNNLYDFASIFLDAWSIVDAIYRIRELVSGMPRLSKRGAKMQVFLRSTEIVETFRHIIQHLRGEIDHIVQSGWTTWGTILFLRRKESDVFSVALLPGRIKKGSFDIINPVGKEISGSISEITLCVQDARRINISDLYSRVADFVKGLEQACAKEWKDEPLAASDMTVAAKIGEK